MSCPIGDLLGMSKVTLPALAAAVLKANAVPSIAGMTSLPAFSTAGLLLTLAWPAAASSPWSLPGLPAA